MQKLLNEFIEMMKDKDIYNEAGIQFELGFFLRNQKSLSNYKIQLERNIDYFGLNKIYFSKKEMDIVIFDENKDKKSCIELKFPRKSNGQVPEQMFKACKDIYFLEQLVNSGFESSYFIFFTDNDSFYHGQNENGIYGIFRNNGEITGTIEKPTGNQAESINIEGKYKINWQNIRDDLKYFIIEVNPKKNK